MATSTAATLLVLLLGCFGAVGASVRSSSTSSGIEKMEQLPNGVLCFNGRAVPNLFLIGCAKCGSTTVYSYLVSELYGKGYVAKTTKEMHYVDRHTPLDTYGWFDGYSQKYPNCTDSRIAGERVKWVVDGSPDYIRHLHAPLEIGTHYARYGLDQELKFMVALRDPTTRILSWFNHLGRERGIPCDISFDDWLNTGLPKVEECLQTYSYLTPIQVFLRCLEQVEFVSIPIIGSWYAVELEVWFRLFPPGRQFLVLHFDDMLTPEGSGRLVRQMMDFLDIPYDEPVPEVVVHKNDASKHADDSGCPEESLSAATRARLDRFFRPWNLQLKALLQAYGLGDDDHLPDFVVRAAEADANEQAAVRDDTQPGEEVADLDEELGEEYEQEYELEEGVSEGVSEG